MRYWLVLAEFHIGRRDIGEAMMALRFALADANREAFPDAYVRAHVRGSILRAMNYARAIQARS